LNPPFVLVENNLKKMRIMEFFLHYEQISLKEFEKGQNGCGDTATQILGKKSILKLP